MQANTLEHEYDNIAAEYGRRVANRFLHGKMYKAGKRSFQPSDFFAMYGDEKVLPVEERTREGAEHLLDTIGWFKLYRPVKREPHHKHMDSNAEEIAALTRWSHHLALLSGLLGEWAIHFIRASLVLDESEPWMDAIANDQGDGIVEREDGDSACCLYFTGWRGWSAWGQSLTETDVKRIEQILTPGFKMPQLRARWPEPGSVEADALMSERDARIAAGRTN
ncbi:hypothetical protein [Paraburkholderia caribensis]|uniref:hypothetical protein n=1 Tax=Paraburkholderia caribensis TaxID=75105 RepID=UPI001CAE6104|nr:hypothetical protein [Paraburkholderia caribensis]CAG9250006.1 conserved hypothetical protein [Paraburkholderia caribensis]